MSGLVTPHNEDDEYLNDMDDEYLIEASQQIMNQKPPEEVYLLVLLTSANIYFSQKQLSLIMKTRFVTIQCAGYIFLQLFCDDYVN